MIVHRVMPCRGACLIAAVALVGVSYAQNWTFTPNTDPSGYYNGDSNAKVQGFITDGNYTLGVATNKSNRGLVLTATRRASAGSNYNPCHVWLAGSGDLDLRKPITDAQANAYYISEIGQQAMDTYIKGLDGQQIPKSNITAVYFPSTCSGIGIYCFREHKSLANLEFNSSVSLNECCFTSCTGLKQVYFRNGAPSSFGPTDPSKYAFSNGPAAKKIRFYISMREAYTSPGWVGVLASTAPVSQEEFNADYPDDDSRVVGLASTTAFRTKTEQYLCYFPELASTVLRVSPGADASFVTITPAAQDGGWEYGSEVTATVSIPADKAAGPNGWRFCGWEGEDVPAGTGAAASFTFVVMPNTDVQAHFHRALRYTATDATNGEVTDGNWRLKVKKITGGLRLEPNCVLAGSGDMDLSGPITDEAGTVYAITRIEGGPFNSTKTSNPVYSFYSPTTTVYISYNLFNGHTYLTTAVIRSDVLTFVSGNTFMNCSALREARFEAPSLVTTESTDSAMNANQFPMCTGLRRLVLKLPALVEMKHNFVTYAPLTETDVSTWQLQSVTNLTSDAVVGPDSGAGPYGTLALPSLVNLERTALKNLRSVSEFQLGTGGLKRLVPLALSTMAGARRIELGVTEDFTCSNTSFGDVSMAALTNLVFTGEVTPTQETVENLLAKVPLLSDSKSQHPAVYMPVSELEWENWLAQPTTEERTNLYPKWIGKGYRLLGIASESHRAAWVFTNSPRGFVLLFR